MAESIETFDRLYLSSDDSSYSALEFLPGSSLGLTEQFLDPNGLRGTRQHDSRRVRRNLRAVQGNLNFAPNPAELALLLPWITGDASNSYTMQETAVARYLRTSRDGTYHLYNGVKVNQATFSCSEGQPLTLSLGVQGVDEATSSAPSGPPTIDDAAGPFVLSDCVLSVGGTEYPFRQFQLSLNNVLETRHNNNLTPTSIHATDFDATVQLGLPYGDASALYGSALAGVVVIATFTNGNVSLAITLNDVAAPRQELAFGSGRQARTLNWAGTARRDASNETISFNLDATV